MKKQQIYILGALCAVLLACGQDSEDATQATIYEGSYQHDCHQESAGEDPTWNITTTLLSGNTISGVSESFSDSSCETRTNIVTVTGNIALVEVATPAEVEGIDIEYTSATMTLYGARSVTESNDQEFFGYSDWEAGTPKDIFGRSILEGADPFFGSGQTLHTLIDLVDNKLCFGEVTDELDGSTAEKRPVAVDLDGCESRL